MTAVLASMGLVGCLDSGETSEDDADGLDTSSDEQAPVLAYEELLDRGQEFVDEARDGHEVRRIQTFTGTVYLERDSDDEPWETTDDPLTTNDIGTELGHLIYDGYVEIDGERYGFSVTSGHGDYAREFVVEPADACEDPVSDLPEPATEVISILVSQGSAWVTDKAFEDVFDADIYSEGTDAWAPLTDIADEDEQCLAYDGQHYEIDQIGALSNTLTIYNMYREDG